MLSRTALLLAMLPLVSWHSPVMGAAADFPSRAIRLIVPFAPGGATDTVARLLAPKLSETWKHNVVIDNRGGGGSTIGTALVTRAEPDGHTLLFVTATFAVNPSLYKKLPYDSVKDLAPVSQVTSSLSILTVHPAVPATSMQQLIGLARKSPGKITYASSGNGSSGHLGIELLKTMTGIDMVHIPYKGAAPATTAILGGEVQAMMGSTAAALPHIRNNRLRALAVTTAKRFSIVPDVPTMAEAGLPGYEADSWFGILAPAGTPADRLQYISTQLAMVLGSPDIRERLSRDGIEARGTLPAAFTRHIAAEMNKWSKVVTAVGMRVD